MSYLWELDFVVLAPLLQQALDHGGNTHTIEDVKDMIVRGEAQFWPGDNAAVVSEIIRYPRKRVCNLWLASGDLAEIDRIGACVSEWAAENGCDWLTLHGRPGWARHFRNDPTVRGDRVTLIRELRK